MASRRTASATRTPAGAGAARSVAGLLAAVLAVAACGVPRGGPPKPVGEAPGVGGTAQRATAARLPDPNDATTPAALVEGYLRAAAAGDWDPAARAQRAERAAQHVRRFLTTEASTGWQPGNQFVLVDLVALSPGANDVVTATLQPIGVLTPYGAIEPQPPGVQPAGPFEYRFAVERTGAGLRLTNPPPGLLLSTTGLAEMYDVRPIYFWDDTQTWLVPDRRYLAKGVSNEKRPTEVVNRLLAGPSSWIESAVIAIPPGTASDNAVFDGSRTMINLSVNAATTPDGLRRLARQLRWSLHPDNHPVELLIERKRQVVDSDDSYRYANAAVPTGNDRTEPAEYCVAAGRVIPVDPRQPRTEVLEAAENANVVSGALHRKRTAVALVRALNGRQELWMGRYDSDLPAARFVQAVVRGSVITRPVWLNAPTARVLVAVDGVLHDVAEDGTRRNVRVPASLGPVTAVAVAPEGRRVALVAGGRVVVAALNFQGNSISLGPPREVFTGRFARHSGVAWAYEDAVVVAGAVGNAWSLVSVSVDSGRRTPIPLENLGTLEITQVASVPRDPTQDNRGPIMIEAGGQAFRVYSSSIEAIALGPAEPSPASGARPSTRPPTGLRAPFYAG